MKTDFDLQRDLTPVVKVALSPFILVTNPKVPANNAKEFIDYLRKGPKDFTWGVGGVGTPGHLALEKFDRFLGVKTDKVAYKGNGPAVAALLSGEVSAMFASPASAQQFVASGQLKALASLSSEPAGGLPTLASAGFSGFEASSWFGIWGPKDLPLDLATRIHSLVVQALAAPEVKSKLTAGGIIPVPSKSVRDFADYVKSETDTNRELVKDLKLEIN